MHTNDPVCTETTRSEMALLSPLAPGTVALFPGGGPAGLVPCPSDRPPGPTQGGASSNRGEPMTLDPQRAKSIFLAALDQGRAGRAAVPDAACSGDADLRRRVDRLLAAHDRPDTAPEAAYPSATAAAPEGRPGAAIGPYKLVELIGEGGMGTVWMAQQQQPV